MSAVTVKENYSIVIELKALIIVLFTQSSCSKWKRLGNNQNYLVPLVFGFCGNNTS